MADHFSVMVSPLYVMTGSFYVMASHFSVMAGSFYVMAGPDRPSHRLDVKVVFLSASSPK